MQETMLLRLLSGRLQCSKKRSEFAGAAQRARRRIGVRGEDASEDALEEALVGLGSCIKARNTRPLLVLLERAAKHPNEKCTSRSVRWVAQNWPEALAKCVLEMIVSDDLQERVLEFILNLLRDSFKGSTPEQRKFSAACLDIDGGAITNALLSKSESFSVRNYGDKFLNETALARKIGNVLAEALLFGCEHFKGMETDLIDLKDDVVINTVDLNIQWAKYVSEGWDRLRKEALESLKADLMKAKSSGAARPFFACFRAAVDFLSSESKALTIVKSANLEVETLLRELQATSHRAHLESATPAGEREEQEFSKRRIEYIARIQLRRLCLLLGSMQEGIRSGILTESCSKILDVSSQHLNTVSALASVLVGLCISHLSDPMKSYSPLLDLLTSEDGIANAVVEILSKGALEHSKQLLPDLFGMLGARSASFQTRKNIMVILQKFFRLGGEDVMEQSEKDMLLTHLTGIVENAEVGLRNEAGSVFGNISPNMSVPFLCKLISTDAKEKRADARSSGSNALAEVFRNHFNTLEVFAIFLKEAKTSNRMLDSCLRWGKKIDAEMWPHIFRYLVLQMLKRPSNDVFVAVARRLGHNFFDERSFEVLETVLEELEKQPQLTESMLSKGSAAEIQALLFRRLSPLLFLNVLNPSKVHRNWEDGRVQRIALLVLERILVIYEFKEVKQMAAEVFALFPQESVLLPVCERLLLEFISGTTGNGHVESRVSGRPELLQKCSQKISVAGKNEENFPPDVIVAKSVLYSLCSSISRSSVEEIPIAVLFHVIEIASLELMSQDGQGMELKNLQEGCLQFLSLSLIGRSESSWKGLKADQFIEVVCDEEDQDARKSTTIGPEVMKFLLKQLDEKLMRSRPQTVVFLSKVLIMTLRTCAQAKSELESVIVGLSQPRVLGEYLLCLNEAMKEQHDQAAVAASLFQLVFTACLLRSKIQLQESDRNEEFIPATLCKSLCGITVKGLDHVDAEVRVASLKLLGALLSFSGEVVFPDGAVAHLFHKLDGLSNLDESEQVRKLAAHLQITTTE